MAFFAFIILFLFPPFIIPALLGSLSLNLLSSGDGQAEFMCVAHKLYHTVYVCVHVWFRR